MNRAHWAAWAIAGLSLVLVVSLFVTGCSDRAPVEEAADVAATNSYLQSVVRDLCGDELEVMCLAPPGMCPGHFDISPAQVNRLRNCRVLLLFDFQQKIESSLGRLKDNGLQTSLIEASSGLCVPQTYLEMCRQVSRVLSQVYPERAAQMGARIAEIETRLSALAAEALAAIQGSGADSADIMVSNHQAEFAEWLGFETVATFVGSDVETISNIDHCLKQAEGNDIRFVVANLQEGTSLANALADRLGAKAVVFSNFPAQVDGATGFDTLVRDNVRDLLEAAQR
jgi:ABC-type Zn uptake system ZnuABC Zn-binding protein ZnuA